VIEEQLAHSEHVDEASRKIAIESGWLARIDDLIAEVQSQVRSLARQRKRVVVCLRAARFWGLAEGHRYGRALFAPPVTRSGYMKKGPMRDKVIRAVRMMISPS